MGSLDGPSKSTGVLTEQSTLWWHDCFHTFCPFLCVLLPVLSLFVVYVSVCCWFFCSAPIVALGSRVILVCIFFILSLKSILVVFYKYMSFGYELRPWLVTMPFFLAFIGFIACVHWLYSHGTRDPKVLHMTQKCYTWPKSVTRDPKVLLVAQKCYIWPRSVTHDPKVLHKTKKCYTWPKSVTQDQKVLLVTQKCYSWPKSVTYDPEVLHETKKCYMWPRSVTCDPEVLHMTQKCYTWPKSDTHDQKVLHMTQKCYTWRKSV